MGDETLRFSIGAVARATGLTVDTLRVWERRYAVVTPTRDERGRLYTSDDVHRLQLLATLVARGHAIGRIARLANPQLALLQAAATTHPAPGGTSPLPGAARRRETTAFPDALLAALQRFDSVALEDELARLGAVLPPRAFVYEVVLPAMQRVGKEWHAGRLTVAQEHLFSAAVRNLLGTLIRLSSRDRVTRRLLFATPSGDRHEFGILVSAMLAALHGVGVVYVGADLPAADIVDAAIQSRVDGVVLGALQAASDPSVVREVRTVASQLPPGVELWLGGGAFIGAVPESRVLHLKDFQAYEQELSRLIGRP
ncbi:MAG: MerR family transcriptional regulator [Vicinamibacterales bacterium]